MGEWGEHGKSNTGYIFIVTPPLMAMVPNGHASQMRPGGRSAGRSEVNTARLSKCNMAL